MRIPLILSILVATSAERMNVRNLTPEKAGLMHTDAFNQLTEIYRDKQPESELELMMEVSKIMEDYCEIDDAGCKSLAYESTLREFHAGSKGPREITYSESMHGGVKQSLEKMFKTLHDIDVDNLNEIVDTLNEISKDISTHDIADPLSKAVGVATVSLAIESSKLWHTVHIGSEHHPLKNLLPKNRRKLQSIMSDFTNEQLFGPAVVVYNVVLADVTSGLANGSNMMNAAGTTSAEALIAWAPVSVIAVTYFAIPASVNAATRAAANFAGAVISIVTPGAGISIPPKP